MFVSNKKWNNQEGVFKTEEYITTRKYLYDMELFRGRV